MRKQGVIDVSDDPRYADILKQAVDVLISEQSRDIAVQALSDAASPYQRAYWEKHLYVVDQLRELVVLNDALRL